MHNFYIDTVRLHCFSSKLFICFTVALHSLLIISPNPYNRNQCWLLAWVQNSHLGGDHRSFKTVLMKIFHSTFPEIHGPDGLILGLDLLINSKLSMRWKCYHGNACIRIMPTAGHSHCSEHVVVIKHLFKSLVIATYLKSIQYTVIHQRAIV